MFMIPPVLDDRTLVLPPCSRPASFPVRRVDDLVSAYPIARAAVGDRSMRCLGALRGPAFTFDPRLALLVSVYRTITELPSGRCGRAMVQFTELVEDGIAIDEHSTSR